MKVISSKISGTWTEENLIGAPVKIKSLRMQQILMEPGDLMKEHTIESIKYRVSEDGKLYPLFKLKDIDSMYFTYDNLFIEGITLDVEEND